MNRDTFDLPQWLAWMEQSHPVAIDMGLERSKQVYDRLVPDYSGITVITLAGTNGKGSSVAMLDAIYRAAGYTTACYTSPHLQVYNERVRLNGQLATDSQLIEAFRAVDHARQDISLTYFEMGTLAALWLIAQQQPQIALLEVGLGGRLDVVNLVDADVAVVTTIDLDHMDWLGDTREKIGFEKAGIFRTGRPAVCGDLAPPQSIAAHAKQLDTPLYQAGEAFRYQAEQACWHWQGKSATGEALEFKALPKPQLPIQNAATVLQTIALAGKPCTQDAIRQGLACARVAGRMENLQYQNKRFVLDVAHNPQSAVYLAQQLAEKRAEWGKTALILGMLADKDCAAVVTCLAPHVDEVHFVTLDVPRGQSATALRQHLADESVKHDIHDSVEDAIQALLTDISLNTVVVAGSFYTVGAASAVLQQPVN